MHLAIIARLIQQGTPYGRDLQGMECDEAAELLAAVDAMAEHRRHLMTDEQFMVNYLTQAR